MKKIFFTFSLLSTLVISIPALALSLGEAKAKGVVGEQSDGYLGVRENSPEVAALVTDINTKRRAEYQNIAEKNGTSVASVEALAGKKAIDSVPAGQFVSTGSGWIKK